MSDLLLTSRPLTSTAEYNRYVTLSIQCRHGDADSQTEKLYVQIEHTPARPHHSTIRPCRQLSRSVDICSHPQYITFWWSPKASWMYATCCHDIERAVDNKISKEPR